MTYPELLGLVRETWGREALPQNGSIVKALVRKYGLDDVEVMVRGAKQLGWTGLLGLNAAEGIGRRWAQAAWWAQENQNPHARQQVESLGALFKARGLL